MVATKAGTVGVTVPKMGATNAPEQRHSALAIRPYVRIMFFKKRPKTPTVL